MRYRRLLMGGFLAVGLAVTAASGAMAEQIIAINSTVEAVDGQATPVTDASQNDQDGAKGSQATENPAAGTDKTQSIENKADYSKWDKLPCFLELVYNFGFLRLNFRCSFAGLERENISLNVCFSSVES